MRRTILRSTTLALVLLIFAGTSRSDEIACNASAVAAFWSLLASARYGEAVQERAEFVTRDASGIYHFIVWRFMNEDRRATYTAQLPRDVVAIVHTHPNSIELPSDNDSGVALRIHLPVYVLTRMRVSKTMKGRTETVLLGDWNPNLRRTTAMTVCAPH